MVRECGKTLDRSVVLEVILRQWKDAVNGKSSP
jgi:hypothetical protein